MPVARARSSSCRAAVLAILLPLSCAAIATPAEPPRLRIGRVASAPTLDGLVAGRLPDGMVKVPAFVQREPNDGEPATRETVAYIGYDDRNLHVLFDCREERDRIRAHMARRESIDGDDLVGVILDTFHDRRHAYVFMINALGVQKDGIATDGQEDDYSFDTVWHTEGRLTADGYVVSVTIPFRSLRFSSADVQTWGVAIGRNIPMRNETSFWPHMSFKTSSQLAQLADLEGLERISPGRNVQFIPYAAFTGSRYLDEDELAYGRDREGRVGLDAKVVLKDALTLDVAANPDFSQVESDEPQVTINQRFEVQFPEKRPFFIENASYFSTPEQLFFSRRIADPGVGARLTGRVGRWNVAGLAMDDRAPGEQAEAGTAHHGDATVAVVGRAVREFWRQSTVGLMVTSRDFAGSSNRVASADLRLRLDDHWTLTGQAIASRTTELDGTKRAGPAFVAGASYSSRTLHLASSYRDRSPGFRSWLGYIPRSDIREWENEIGYTFHPKDKWVLSWGPAVEATLNWDRQDRLQEWEVHPEVEIEMPAGTQLHLHGSRSYELYEGFGFDKHDAGVFLETQRLGWLWLEGSYSQGRSINYYPPDGVLPFLADSREAEAGLTFRPVPAVRVEQAYIYSALSTDMACAWCGTVAGYREKSSIFALHMWRTKANYQFTRELSLRAILDYNVLNPSAAFVSLDRERRLTADVLVTYLLTPGTALYVGYTDAYANLRVDPSLPPSARFTDSATTSVGRQFFVKFSYLFRK